MIKEGIPDPDRAQGGGEHLLLLDTGQGSQNDSPVYQVWQIRPWLPYNMVMAGSKHYNLKNNNSEINCIK